MYLAAVSSYSDTKAAGDMVKIFDDAVSAVTNLAPVMSGADLGPTTAKTLSDVSAGITPIIDLIQIFDPSKVSTAQKPGDLREGTTVVKTQFSVLTIVVECRIPVRTRPGLCRGAGRQSGVRRSRETVLLPRRGTLGTRIRDERPLETGAAA
jgi:hypothetical protein